MTYTPNYPSTGWRDLPDESTEIDADALNHIEAGIVAAAATADAALAGLDDKADTAAVAAKYAKPAPGIPGTDMTAAVQASLSKADTAVQPAALATKANLVDDGTGNMVLATSEVPAITVTDTFVVSTQAAQLALVAQKGDNCKRTDLGKMFVLGTGSPTVLANWIEYPSGGASGAVDSVNGQTGIVVLGKANVGLGNADNTSDVNKPVSTATATELNNINTYLTGTVTPAINAKLENLTERNAWTATTAYAKGDIVTANYARWYCRTAHTSGGSFAETNWIHLGLYAVGAASDPGVTGRLWVKI